MTQSLTALSRVFAVFALSAAPALADAEAAGSIAGIVELDGAPPAREPLSMAADPVCARAEPQRSEDVVAKRGKLRDVHVRIRAGTVDGEHDSPEERVEIDQRDCMYRPRVVGVMVGQKLAIGNSDRTLHNIHGYAGGKSRFNLGQPPRGPTIEREVGGAGEVLELRCDIHPWMRAYAVVSDHPFFDVTGDDGSFSIEGVPPGRYTLEAWHPKLGLERVEVEVRAGRATRQTFSLSAD